MPTEVTHRIALHCIGCIAGIDEAQLAWLEKDLAAAAAPLRRQQVPWLIVTSHFPLYHDRCSAYVR